MSAGPSRPAPGSFAGIHAILYALFDRSEQLDRAAMRRQTEFCLATGVHAIGALGLATEVAKLTEAERRAVMDWLAEDNAGRVPLYFTVLGASVAEQVAQIRHAEAAGADWVILQPPPVGSYGAAEYIAFFGRVAAETALPVGIQNAPAFLGRGLTADEIAQLVSQHPNIRLLKAEGPAVDIERVIAATGERVPVLNGLGGLELMDNLRAGCAGLILALDIIDYAVLAYEHFRAGREAEAEAVYARLLPAATFAMKSVESMVGYGKRVFGFRAGIAIHDRAPSLRPTQFGLEMARKHAERLKSLTEPAR
jgi:dihydrodipicolinate synthase/N-acetylneuraminate lyase